ncbi:prenyltransferase/squalene oxidase repeat-containing protein [Feifania hominis]|uniref:Terpene cyclase/mutase family protein n=1 Tax=Feifania hominis TaxID=2763660 RepID=A0A926DBQ2_9FIRM|nr:prenyltransferase/squalene oxidase repeat-containing protein [Feifania hominis]MBC8535291.1 terpene cyclase/mutase family protein [Feifania hominis]
MKKRTTALFCVVILIVAALSGCASKKGVLDFYKQNPPDHWWEIAAITASGGEVDHDAALTIIRKIKLDEGVSNLVGAAYALEAIGEDPHTALGVDLPQEIANAQQADGGFGYLNETVYAVLALEHFSQSYNRTAALDAILEKQLDSGAFCFSPEWGESVDVTGMALSALSLYDDDRARQAVEEAVAYLDEVQLEDGGFAEMGLENATTLATVITGLQDCGVDLSEKRWNKIVDELISYQLEDGGFKNEPQDKQANRMTTYQALTALDAVTAEKSFFVRGAVPAEQNEKK